MKLFSIFASQLYSIKYDGEVENEFDRLFKLWMNVEFVSEFIHRNAPLLKDKFWKGYSENDVVMLVRNEAINFQLGLSQLYHNTIKGNFPDFDNKFEPIHLGDTGGYYELVESEIHGADRTVIPYRTVLRFYAVKVDVNTYVIGGGGIKLTKTYEGTPGLSKEVAKLGRLKQYLMANGIFDKENLRQFEDEQNI